MPEINFYDALGIQRGATPAEVRAAWRKQSINLHPDKNAFGVELMKLVNEAYNTLSDESKRRRYDRELASGSHSSNRNNRRYQQDTTELEEELAESKRKCANYKKRVISLQKEADNTREEAGSLRDELDESNSLLSKKNTQIKQLQHKQKAVKNEVKYHKQQSELLEEEKQDQRKQIDICQDKIDKAGRVLREERRKSADFAAREQKAINDSENIKKTLSERSVCYSCNGQSTKKDDCAICNGNGAVQGIWTKCHSCNGKGAIEVFGKEDKCTVCSSKGAREGLLSMTCFKCKGSKGCDDCTAGCYNGRIKGFNLMLCPLCKGIGDCENCFGTAFVACTCGPVCKGHSVYEAIKPSTPSSLQRKLSLMNEKEDEKDWKSTFRTRSWFLPI